MACSNCFNGCAETVSDQCIKYTGNDIPALGISNGDTLAHIEDVLTKYIQKIIDGTGIYPVIDPLIICAYVTAYLPPCCGPYNVNDFITTIIKALCDLNNRLVTVEGKIAALNSPYTLDCVTGVTDNSDTHEVLQETINFLCGLSDDVEALTLELHTEYTKTTDLNTVIANYINSAPASTLLYFRMVPFTVVEYYGSLANFSAAGVGLGNYVNIYLCNGANGTPDKRGRVGVGVTSVPGGGDLPAQTDPLTPFANNPNYVYNTPIGTNSVTLLLSQIPSHNHVATFTPIAHTHDIDFKGELHNTGNGLDLMPPAAGHGDPIVITTKTALAGGTITVTDNGGSGSHLNYQPGLPCYYIMYIPA